MFPVPLIFFLPAVYLYRSGETATPTGKVLTLSIRLQTSSRGPSGLMARSVLALPAFTNASFVKFLGSPPDRRQHFTVGNPPDAFPFHLHLRVGCPQNQIFPGATLTHTFKLLVLCGLWLFVNPASAQVITGDIRAAAEALRDKALTDSLAYDIVESLTMEVGPRPAGSAGDKAAVRWALAKLEALGFENVRAEPVTVPHWDRGTLNVRITSPFPQLLVATSLGGSSGTPAQGINAEVVRVASLAELRALDDQKLAGRIAYIDHVMEKSNSGPRLWAVIAHSWLRSRRCRGERRGRHDNSLRWDIEPSRGPYRKHAARRYPRQNPCCCAGQCRCRHPDVSVCQRQTGNSKAAFKCSFTASGTIGECHRRGSRHRTQR